MGYRNISLVAGALGVARVFGRFGRLADCELRACSAVMPEPGATLQLLAGVIGLLGIAVWRSRRVR